MSLSQKKSNIPEITLKGVIIGIILAFVFGASNAYLGLFAGMTLGASIPAAIVSLGILKFFKNANILENNIIQTTASSGNGVAAGIIFTFPALIMLGYWDHFKVLEIIFLATIGGIMGVLFSIPLRRALIIESKLKYPEGLATAAILQTVYTRIQSAAEAAKTKTGTGILVISAIGAVIIKTADQAFNIWNSTVGFAFQMRKSVFGFGTTLSPALIAIGYIIGTEVSVFIFLGGVLAWFIGIPICSFFTSPSAPISLDSALGVWSSQIRYIGVGGILVAGILTVLKLIKPVIIGFKATITAHNKAKKSPDEILPNTEKDLPFKTIIVLLLAAAAILLLYFSSHLSLPIAFIITIMIFILGLIFTAMIAYIAGIAGSANSPVSSITILTILITAIILFPILGISQPLKAAALTIFIGSVVGIGASVSCDTMQDLKAGYILGSTSWKLQFMQIVGTIAASIAIAPVLILLDSAYKIGSSALPAPQATLMKAISEGIFQGNVKWGYLITGMAFAACIAFIDKILEKKNSRVRLPAMIISFGIYLPILITSTMFIGGLLHYVIHKKNNSEASKQRGLLVASGLIAGESIAGILLAFPIFLTGNKNFWPGMHVSDLIGIVVIIILILAFSKITNNKWLKRY